MQVKTYQHLNLAYLDLMTDGDAAMKKMMLDILFEELPADLKKLTLHYANADWLNLKSLTHKLKSTLSFIGNDEMTRVNKQIEANAMYEQNLDDIPSLIKELNDIYPLVMAELNSFYASLS